MKNKTYTLILTNLEVELLAKHLCERVDELMNYGSAQIDSAEEKILEENDWETSMKDEILKVEMIDPEEGIKVDRISCAAPISVIRSRIIDQLKKQDWEAGK